MGKVSEKSNALKRWNTLAKELEHPAVELDTEAVAILLATYADLDRLGHKFDPMFRAIMKQFVYQSRTMEEFNDGDGDDCGTDESNDPQLAWSCRRMGATYGT